MPLSYITDTAYKLLCILEIIVKSTKNFVRLLLSKTIYDTKYFTH